MERILVTGKAGQVGYELERSLQTLGAVIAVDRNQMDLADLDSVREVIRRVQPTLIVNPAAYTAVDRAESEPELAMRINADAPGVMAEEAKRLGAAVIHYSTDYVFDGTKDGAYTEEDPPRPINVYGKTKLAGEQAIAAAGGTHLILRTSWVYGMRGKNFLLTMRRLAAERDELRVVADQHGAPTWCRTIADVTACIVAQAQAAGSAEWLAQRSGAYHLTAQGRTSWHGFADALLAHPSIGKKPVLIPIPAADYPVPAPRPANSSLDSGRLMRTFCTLPDWREALRLCQD